MFDCGPTTNPENYDAQGDPLGPAFTHHQPLKGKKRISRARLDHIWLSKTLKDKTGKMRVVHTPAEWTAGRKRENYHCLLAVDIDWADIWSRAHTQSRTTHAPTHQRLRMDRLDRTKKEKIIRTVEHELNKQNNKHAMAQIKNNLQTDAAKAQAYTVLYHDIHMKVGAEVLGLINTTRTRPQNWNHFNRDWQNGTQPTQELGSGFFRIGC